MNEHDNWQRKKIHASRAHQEEAFSNLNGMVVRKRNGKIITLIDGAEITEFISCSYLGLDQDPRLLAAVSNSLHEGGINFAVARTRFRMENSVLLEEFLGDIFFNARAITFTSLHLVHLGMIPLLASGEMPSFPLQKNGIHFILDKSVHASIQINRGLMSQFGPISVIDFHNADDLKNAFQSANSAGYTPVAFADGIGSMGYMASVKTLVSLAESYNGYLYIDDAHGTSVFGQHGAGYVLEQIGAPFYPRLILTASLSKAFGTHGAALVVPSQADEVMIRHYCNPYLFSNPMPFHVVEASIAAAKIHLSDELPKLQNALHRNLSAFDSLMRGKFFILNLDTLSPIRCIYIGEELKTIDIGLKLRENGFAVTTAMYPTVAKGQSIIRLAICANHTLKDIELLCAKFARLCPPVQKILLLNGGEEDADASAQEYKLCNRNS